MARTVHIAFLHENRIERIDFEAESIDLQFLRSQAGYDHVILAPNVS